MRVSYGEGADKPAARTVLGENAFEALFPRSINLPLTQSTIIYICMINNPPTQLIQLTNPPPH